MALSLECRARLYPFWLSINEDPPTDKRQQAKVFRVWYGLRRRMPACFTAAVSPTSIFITDLQ